MNDFQCQQLLELTYRIRFKDRRTCEVTEPLSVYKGQLQTDLLTDSESVTFFRLLHKCIRLPVAPPGASIDGKQERDPEDTSLSAPQSFDELWQRVVQADFARLKKDPAKYIDQHVQSGAARYLKEEGEA